MEEVFTSISTEVANMADGNEIFSVLFALDRKIDSDGIISSIQTPNEDLLSQEEIDMSIEKAINRGIISNQGSLRINEKYLTQAFREEGSNIVRLRRVKLSRNSND